MTRIYLIRHGEAEGNLYRRMHGQYNSDVTALGREQIAALGRRFADIHIDAVYSSDLYRTMLTASSICIPRNLPLITDRRLREVNVGPWEDRPFGSAWVTNPDQMRLFTRDPDHWDMPDSDTFRALAGRGYEALMEIVEENPGKTVAVCIHSFIIGALLCKLFYGFDASGYAAMGHSDNTAVTLLTYENGTFRLEFQHDSSHLDAENLRRHRWRPEGGSSDLHIRPMGQDIDQYIKYRGDAWQLIYGSLRDFNGPAFWMDAQSTMGGDPEAMVVGYLGRTPVGMIQLSPDRDERKGVGYIPFIYLREPFRHKGLGIQLIGHAVSFYRKRGRNRLQLSVAPTNENAIAFYEKYGFRAVGKSKGRYGKLILMEKNIQKPELPKELRVIQK